MRSPANTEAPARQCPSTSRTSSPASAARQVSHFPQKELALWKMTPDSPPNRASRAICQGVYPSGLVVGTVMSLEEDPGGLTRSAILTPAADLNTLSQVFVVTAFWEER